MAEFKDYVYEGTNVLKNKLDIRDPKELKRVEEEMIVEKLAYLSEHLIDTTFNTEHLKKLHMFLFGDLYEFAGHYRDVEMFKEQTSYLDYHAIPIVLPQVLEEYKNNIVKTSSSFEIGLYLANFYNAIINVHPFRDGNSRTTREFLREFVQVYFPDYKLNYSLMDPNNFKLALKEKDSYSINLLAYEFYKALVKKDIQKNI